jgi:putative nucleotidyltransferase with HDIG domain
VADELKAARLSEKPLMKLSSLAEAKRFLKTRIGDRKRILLGAGTVVVITVLLSTNLVPTRFNLRIGEIATEDIRANRTVEYVNQVETEKLRQQAMLQIPPKYRVDEFAAQDSVKDVDSVFEIILSAKVSSPKPASDIAEEIYKASRIRLSPGAVSVLTECDLPTLQELRSHARRIVGETMSREIRNRPDDLPASRTKVVEAVAQLPISEKFRPALAEICRSALRYNRLYDFEATDKARREEAMRVPPVRWTIMKGEVIVREGEVVKREHIDKLTALGLMHPQTNLGRVAWIAVLVAALVALCSLYLSCYHSNVYKEFKLLGLLALIATVSVAGMKIGVNALNLKTTGFLVGYVGMLWIASASMLSAALVNPSVGSLMAALLAVGTGISMDIELRYVAASLVSSLVGIYAVARIVDRNSLVRLVLAMAFANTAAVWIIAGVSDSLSPMELVTGAAWGVGSGVFSALLFWLGVAVFEKPFGVITHVGLLELADPNQPILRKLLMEAPGTYHHSMVVGSLAEAAAEAIGADPLLARAQAYYHDIGKMKRPHFFVENQRFGNLHDRLNPSLSMLVIASHVRDGIELARQYKLPPQIIDGIREHHGTSLVSFFYQQACLDHPPSAVLEQHFRYEGPKPRSKETAILMLADSVEAASRTLYKPTPGRIENMVSKIVHARLEDGQLDESDLTFRDIEKIIASFTRTLCGMLHARLEYPEPVVSAPRRIPADVSGSVGAEQPKAEAEEAEGPGQAAAGL